MVVLVFVSKEDVYSIPSLIWAVTEILGQRQKTQNFKICNIFGPNK